MLENASKLARMVKRVGVRGVIRNVPVWASLIALVDDEEVIVGVVSAPALGRRWWASHGGGAWLSEGGTTPRSLAVSAVDSLSQASMSYSSLSGWQERGLLPGFLSLADQVWRTRAYGDFWSYMLVAEGANYIVSGEWWLALFPGAALMLAVFTFNLLGDGLRDLVDPQRRT